MADSITDFHEGDEVTIKSTVKGTVKRTQGSLIVVSTGNNIVSCYASDIVSRTPRKAAVGDTLTSQSVSKYKITAIDPDGNWLLKALDTGSMWVVLVKDQWRYTRVQS